MLYHLFTTSFLFAVTPNSDAIKNAVSKSSSLFIVAIIPYPSNFLITSAKIPSTITTIGNNVFYNNFGYLTIYGDENSAAQKYANENNINFSTSKIEITDKFFGERDFKIINSNVKIVDKYISIIDYNEDLFMEEIKDVSISEKDDYVIAKVIYDYDKYLYTFYKKNNVLKIYDVEVLEWRKFYYY